MLSVSQMDGQVPHEWREVQKKKGEETPSQPLASGSHAQLDCPILTGQKKKREGERERESSR